MAPPQVDEMYLPPGPEEFPGETTIQYASQVHHVPPPGLAPYQVFVMQSQGGAAPLPDPVQPTPSTNSEEEASLRSAYICAVAPIGIFGAQHFYLRRYSWGVLYLFTFGLVGIGYISDWFRVPELVNEYNSHVRSGQREQSLALRNTFEAYQMWFPLGLFGFHHYYLRRWSWGIAYTFTIGLFGIGWLVDLCRIPFLVMRSNAKLRIHENITNSIPFKGKRLSTAYIMALPPMGLVGGHHYFLNNIRWGVLYTFTLGLLGSGWLIDMFRLPNLVKRANTEKSLLCDSTRAQRAMKYTDNAYVLWFPFGLFGFHHFYLGRYGWGILYLCTLGFFGVGWLIDAFNIPNYVEAANKRLLNEAGLEHQVHINMGNSMQQPSQVFIIAPPPPSQLPQQGYIPQPNNVPSDHDGDMPPSYDSIMSASGGSTNYAGPVAIGSADDHQNLTNERLDSLALSASGPTAPPLAPKSAFPQTQ